MTIREVLALIKAKDVRLVDFKFCDIHGCWHHLTVPAESLDAGTFEQGLGFDGSSIRGWKGIEASDMLLIPDPKTAFIDPFSQTATLSLSCDVVDPIQHAPYGRSPRGIAKKAQQYMESTGIADTAFFGPEAEFFIFDNIQYSNSENEAFYHVDSNEGIWTSGKDEGPNLGHKIRHKEGYMPVSPADKTHDLRNAMVLTMMELGMPVECHHHEVATGGQAEIDLRYKGLLEAADQLCLYKYVVKNVANAHGKSATFMPKPVYGDNGSGMHIHISLWKKGKTLMAGDKYADLSQEALWFIGGILRHAPALCALCNPTNNSYKRLAPGYEAPVQMAYSARNRSAICRIPTYSNNPSHRRVEYRCPDPSANPYIAFSALLMAGLDGIENKLDPGPALDKNLYNLSKEESKAIGTLPDSLRGALEALQQDNLFLRKGDVFTEDFLDTFIEMKYKEYDAVRIRPHPYEYELYYGI